MQKISLCDELTFDLLPRGIEVSCNIPELPLDERNLVYRAAQSYFEMVGYRGGVSIRIHKKIPIGGGLGGGSSNAAITLLALRELLALKTRAKDLYSLACTLGADVPFFLFAGAAWAFGRGDEFKKVQTLPSLWFLLINPGFPVSTKEVYEALNLGLTNEPNNYKKTRFYIGRDLSFATLLANDLEQVTFGRYPFLREVKEELIKLGALGALMSGSGPTIYGIFSEEEKAQAARASMVASGKHWWTYVARSL